MLRRLAIVSFFHSVLFSRLELLSAPRVERWTNAKPYGISSVPTVVVDGKVPDSCKRSAITPDDLKAAGIRGYC